MSKHKAHGKDKKKASQLVIRVEKAERDAFVALCNRLDTSAAREIRRFMRERVAEHTVDAADETETQPVTDAFDDAPLIAEPEPALTFAETDVVSDAPAVEAEKPKKKQKRAAS